MVDSAQLVGSTIAGKYQVRRILGEGGMGAVFEAEHVEIGKRVAVKVITGEGLSSQEAEGRFRREARAASAVESDHIVQVFDVGRDERAGLFMVMEYLTGSDLASRISQEGRLDTGTVLTVGVQVARGLAKAHAAGVIHRDLKPANIFLISRDDGSTFVKILDFGISKLSQEQDKPNADGAKLTRAGTAIGTPEYMSPEQVQGLASIDGRSDVWSLGAVLYECLAGRSPFSGYDTYEQTVIAVVTQPTKPLEEVAPWVPLPVAAVIGKALRRDLSERFDSCGAFGVALAAAAKEVFPDMAGSAVFNTGTGAAVSSPVVFGSSETSSSAATVAAWPKATSTATAPAVVLGSKGDAAPSNPPAPEGDDDIAIPGVGARKGLGLPLGLTMAAAAIIALVFGAKSALEKSTQSSASAGAAPAPQGLVETKPLPASPPPVRLPERSTAPVAVPEKDPGGAKEPAAAKPVAGSNTAGANVAVAKPVSSSPPVGGAASKPGAANGASGKEGDLGVQEAPANPPNRKPTSGEVFGGVNLSDDY